MATQRKANTNTNGSGFVRAGVELKHRLIICSGALAKCGKTYFGLTMPGPLAIINLDEGLDGVIQSFQKDKEIWVADHRAAMVEIKAEAGEKGKSLAIAELAEQTFERVRKDYLEAIREAKSVFVDTGTEFYELLRLAHFGKLTQVMPHQYGVVNRDMKSFIDLAYSSNANVVFSHRLKREYVNDKSTNNLILAGWNDMGYECQLGLRHWKEPSETFPERFHLMITDSRIGPQIEGEELSGETATFPFVASLAFGDSPEDWQ